MKGSSSISSMKRPDPRVRLVAVFVVICLVLLVCWRRSVMLAALSARLHPSHNQQGVVELPSPFKDTKLQETPDDMRGRHFVLDLASHRYPTIVDFLNRTEGHFGDVAFRSVSRVKPRAILLDNMMPAEDCQAIISIAEAQIARSEVVHRPGESAISMVRTSFGMFIMDSVAADQRLRAKAASIVGVPKENLEATQILRYLPGQYYRLHPDYFYDNAKEHLTRGGQRFATVLTWLNNVSVGGETRFTYAQPPITVRPGGAGNSVLFYSMSEDGVIDIGSQHEAIPPGDGSVKWVAVIWIRQHEFH